MDITLSVEGYIWEGGCRAFKIDIGVVEEVGHGMGVVYVGVWHECSGVGILFSGMPERETRTWCQERNTTGRP